jgi:CxxC-x17-CxxC domain-containing protein
MGSFNDNRSFGRRGSKSSFKRRDSKPAGGTHFSRNTRRFGPRDSGGSKLEFHTTTCARCGKRCEVPFKPNNKKPVYCSDCFRKAEDPNFDNEPAPRQDRGSGNDLRQINEKLDRILRILEEN